MNATALIGQAQDAYSVSQQKRFANGVNTPGSEANLNAAKKTADDFESFFIGQMLEHMTAGIEVDSEFGGGHAEEMWRSMMNQEYGKHIVKSGGLGISNQVMTSMLKAQEEATMSQQKLNDLSLAQGK